MTAEGESREIETFRNIFIRGSGDGVFKAHKDGFSFKATENSRITHVATGDIGSCSWMDTGYGSQLRVQYKRHGGQVIFHGFASDDFDRLSAFAQKTLGLSSIEKVDQEVSGVNWGEVNFDDRKLVLNSATADYDGNEVDGGKQILDITLNEVTQASVQGKTDVALEFGGIAGSGTAGPNEDELAEVRFYIPQMPQPEGEEENEENDETMTPSAFQSKVLAHADQATETGELLAQLDELAFEVPRGRYDVRVYSDSLKMRGKTYEYQVTAKQISEMYLLPRPDQTHVDLVIALVHPLRQGQTQYKYLIIKLDKEEEVEEDHPVRFTFPDDAELKAAMVEKGAEENMSGPFYEIVAKILKATTGKKLMGPGKFRSHGQNHAIRCSYKANDGLLFPTEKAFFFLHKPTMFVRHAEIRSISFGRGGSVAYTSTTTKNFDVSMELKNGQELTFSNITKNEFQGLQAYAEAKGMKVVVERSLTGEEDEETGRKAASGSMDDAYAHRLREEADAGDDDDDESDDEDFHAESGSEPDEEYDEELDAKPYQSSDDGGSASGSDDDGSDGSDYAGSESDEDEGSAKKKRRK